MASKAPDPPPLTAPTLEQISKVWNSLPVGLGYATANELQELNEICCFNLEQVNIIIFYIFFIYPSSFCISFFVCAWYSILLEQQC